MLFSVFKALYPTHSRISGCEAQLLLIHFNLLSHSQQNCLISAHISTLVCQTELGSLLYLDIKNKQASSSEPCCATLCVTGCRLMPHIPHVRLLISMLFGIRNQRRENKSTCHLRPFCAYPLISYVVTWSELWE